MSLKVMLSVRLKWGYKIGIHRFYNPIVVPDVYKQSDSAYLKSSKVPIITSMIPQHWIRFLSAWFPCASQILDELAAISHCIKEIPPKMINFDAIPD